MQSNQTKKRNKENSIENSSSLPPSSSSSPSSFGFSVRSLGNILPSSERDGSKGIKGESQLSTSGTMSLVGALTGVKNIINGVPTQETNQQSQKQMKTLSGMIQKLRLQTPESHLGLVVAFSESLLTPVMHGDLEFTWFRSTHQRSDSSQASLPLTHLTHSLNPNHAWYPPCADDIGHVITVSCRDLCGYGLSRKIGSKLIQADREVSSKVEEAIQKDRLISKVIIGSIPTHLSVNGISTGAGSAPIETSTLSNQKPILNEFEIVGSIEVGSKGILLCEKGVEYGGLRFQPSSQIEVVCCPPSAFILRAPLWSFQRVSAPIIGDSIPTTTDTLQSQSISPPESSPSNTIPTSNVHWIGSKDGDMYNALYDLLSSEVGEIQPHQQKNITQSTNMRSSSSHCVELLISCRDRLVRDTIVLSIRALAATIIDSDDENQVVRRLASLPWRSYFNQNDAGDSPNTSSATSVTNLSQSSSLDSGSSLLSEMEMLKNENLQLRSEIVLLSSQLLSEELKLQDQLLSDSAILSAKEQNQQTLAMKLHSLNCELENEKMARNEIEMKLHLHLISRYSKPYDKISPPPPPPVSTPVILSNNDDSSATVSTNSDSFLGKFNYDQQESQESNEENEENLRHLSESGVIFPIIEATSGELLDGFQNPCSRSQSFQEETIIQELNQLLVSLVSLNAQVSQVLHVPPPFNSEETRNDIKVLLNQIEAQINWQASPMIEALSHSSLTPLSAGSDQISDDTNILLDKLHKLQRQLDYSECQRRQITKKFEIENTEWIEKSHQLETSLQQKETEFLDLQTKMERMKSSHLTLQNMVTKLQEQNKQVMGDWNQMKIECESSKIQWNEMNGKYQKMIHEVTARDQDSKTYQEITMKLQHENEVLIDNKHHLEHQFKLIEEKNHSLSSELNRLSSENTEHDQTIFKLRTQVNELESRLAYLQSESLELSDSKHNLMKQISQFDSMKIQFLQVKSQLVQSDQELTGTKQHLTEITIENEKLKRYFIELQTENTSKKNQIEKSEQRQTELVTRLESIEKETLLIEKDRQSLRKENIKLRNSFNSLTEESEQLKRIQELYHQQLEILAKNHSKTTELENIITRLLSRQYHYILQIISLELRLGVLTTRFYHLHHEHDRQGMSLEDVSVQLSQMIQKQREKEEIERNLRNDLKIAQEADPFQVKRLNFMLAKLHGEKNHYENKAKSLSKDLQRKLLAGTPLQRELARVTARLEELENERNAYRDAMVLACDTYTEKEENYSWF